ncbi:MAG: D-alanine--D-alanine ligase [Lachnospiraceae bacterium]|nr:D-alanine--D-alanine ligase [Lachnospiraceae bacterium]
MEKKTLLGIFGGQSSEHDISCLSAYNVFRAVSPAEYRLLLVGITKEGKWLLVPDVEAIRDGSWKDGTVRAVLAPDAEWKSLLVYDGGRLTAEKVDVVFPVLHGLYGEDGTIQGLIEMAGIPYVGCGVYASAAAMDKVCTKAVVERLGIRQAAYVALYRHELADIGAVMDRVEAAIPYPVFVKPSRAGSSVGVRKAVCRAALEEALLEAAKWDSKILVEETITGRELECAVLSDGQKVLASGVGEILSAAEFYDFDAKYNNADSRTEVNPGLPAEVREEIRKDAERIFRAIDGYGLSRVDFFLDGKGVVFNEINTIPGFTAISMYPMLFGDMGIGIGKLVDALIASAFHRTEP